MSVTSLSLARVSAHKIDHSYHHETLPVLKGGIERDVLQTGLLANGLSYSLQLMTLDDAESVHAVLGAAEQKFRDKKYLLPRTLQDVKKALHYDANKKEGGFIMGIVINGDQLAGVVGGEDIDNEQDSGRGVPFMNHPITEQFCWKMAGIHPDMAGHRLYDLVPAMRMAVTMDLFPQKTCIITKTNNPHVKNNYGKTLEWDLEEIYDLQQDICLIDYMYAAEDDHDGLLHTYVTYQDREIAKLMQENGDIVKRSGVLRGMHDHHSFSQSRKKHLYQVA